MNVMVAWGRLVLKYTVVRSWTEDVHYHRGGSDSCWFSRV
jgi:hypothetical protein